MSRMWHVREKKSRTNARFSCEPPESSDSHLIGLERKDHGWIEQMLKEIRGHVCLLRGDANSKTAASFLSPASALFCNATHQESSSLKKWRLILHLSNLEDPCDLFWPTEDDRGHTMWPSSLNLWRPSSFSSHPLEATQGKTTLWGCYWEMRLGVAETIISLWASSSDRLQPLTTQHVSMPSWSIWPTWVLLKPLYSSYM